MTKVCSRCGEDKPLESFSKDKKSDSGLRSYCRTCASTYDRQYRRSDHGANVRRAYKSTVVGRLHRRAERHRRRARNMDAGPLTRTTLEIVMLRNKVAYGRLTCVYCKADVEDSGWHLEHFTPLSKGGTNTVDNLGVSCPTCNTSKGVKAYADVDRLNEDYLRVEQVTFVERILHAAADKYDLLSSLVE